MKILVTGHLGYCGVGIVEVLLNYGHQVVGFDRSTSKLSKERDKLREVQGDITNLENLVAAMVGCQAVVHAAVGTRVRDQDAEDYSFVKLPARSIAYDHILPYHINVTGSFYIFETARQLGVRQIVNLSSAAVVFHHIVDREDGNIRQFQLRGDTPPNFRGFYGLNKHLQEQIGAFFARVYELSVVTFRPWWAVDGPTYTNRYGVDLSQDTHPLSPVGLVCRYDLGEAVQRALERPDIQYDVFYPVSGPCSERYFDVEHVQRELSWYPRYTFEELA
jgi:nucleoside-diphosphate-sugar epimerase